MTAQAAIIIGLTLVAGGGVMLLMSLRFLRRSRPAMARVTGYREDRNQSMSDGSVVFYFPRFEFVTERGRKVQTESRAGEGEPVWPVGETVAIRYLPEAPERVRPDGARYVYVMPALMAALGLFFVVLGLVQ